MSFHHYSNKTKDTINRVLQNRGVNPQITNDACDELISEAQSGNDVQLLGFAYYYKAENCYILNDSDEFLHYIMASMSLLEESGQWELLARAYNFVAILSTNRGNAPFAMDYYLTALKYTRKYKLTSVEIMVNINIGSLHQQFGDRESARRWYEDSLRLLRRNTGIPEFVEFQMSVYFGLINVCLARGDALGARNYLEMTDIKEQTRLDMILALCFYSIKARVLHAERKTALRDQAIETVSDIIKKDFPLVDVFGDLFLYCEMLLDAEKYEELWETLNKLESLAGYTNVHFIQKRLLELKIRYYKIQGDNAGFLQAAGLYFELSMMLEKENAVMIGKMLNMRSALEESTKRQQQMKEENAAIRMKSETDALTGLSNRFRLHDEATAWFEEAKEKKEWFGIEIMDIDYFKGFNDNYGHQAGDRCIKGVADRIGSMQEKPNIFAARYGGDEFILLFRGYDKEGVENIMSELRDKIVNMNMKHEYSAAAPYVTISQGACCGIPSGNYKVSDYLETADHMLYKIKEISRNSYCACEFGGLE